MKRSEILAILDLSSAALAKEGEKIVPAFAGFKLDGVYITSHDDIVAVRLPFKTDFKGVAPAHTLLKFLKACTKDEVEITAKKEELTVKCGRPKLTLSMTSLDSFPFQFPKFSGKIIRDLNDDFFTGLALCSKVVSDHGLSSWVGGLVFDFGKALRLYSTSDSRDCICAYSLPKLGVDGAERLVISLPVSFVKIAMDMRRVFKDVGAQLGIRDNYAIISFGDKASVMGKVIDPTGRPDIPTRIREHLKSKSSGGVPLSKSVHNLFSRAAAVSGKDERCSLSVVHGKLRLGLQSGPMQFDDGVALKGEHAKITVTVDPRLSLKMMDQCDTFRVLEGSMVLWRGSKFTYITANKNV